MTCLLTCLAACDYQGSSKVVIAKIDATENDLPKALKVEGFPTLMLFKGDGTAPKKHEVSLGSLLTLRLREAVLSVSRLCSLWIHTA